MIHRAGSLARVAPLLAFFLLAGAAVAPPASAQDRSFEYTEATRVEAAGVVGALLASAGNEEEARSVHLLGSKVRTDDGASSTIFDAEAREWIVLEHDSRSYVRFTLTDVRETVSGMREAMREEWEEWDDAQEDLEEARADAEAAMEEARASMDVSVEHAPLGPGEEILGFATEGHQILLRVENAEGIQGAEEVEGGALVLLVDVQLSGEFERANPLHGGADGDGPFARAMMEDPAFRALGEDLAADFEPGAGPGDAAAYAVIDPRVGAALEEAMGTLAELEGAPLRTRTVFAVLPPAAEMDADLLRSWEPESMGAQLQGQATESAREAAQDAARDAVRGLTRGLIGGGGDDDEGEVPAEELVIRPLLRMTTEVTEVRTEGVPTEEMFTIPEGYSELSFGPGAPPEPGA